MNVKGILFLPVLVKTLIASLLLCFALISQSFADLESDLDFYLKRTDYIDLQLSPDGKTYFAYIRGADSSYLVFVDVASKKPISSIKAGEEDLIYDYAWISNTEVIYRFGRHVWWTDRPVGTGELMRYDLGNKRRNKMSWGGNYVSHVLSNQKLGDEQLLVARWLRSRSGKMRAEIGKVRSRGRWSPVETLPMPGSLPVASIGGELKVFNYTDEDFNDYVYYREEKGSDWKVLDIADKGSQCFVEFLNFDASKVYLNCETGAEEKRRIIEWHWANNTFTQLFGAEAGDVGSVIRDPKTGDAVAAIYLSGTVEYVYREGQGFVLDYKRLVKAFKGQRVEISSHSKDGNVIVVHVSGDTNPGEFYLYNRETKKADFLMAARSWMDRGKLQPMESLEFTARDGLKFNGYLTRATGGDSKKMIVYPHGGPHGVYDIWGFDETVQLLAAQGFNVLQVNFRGSGGQGKRFEREGYLKWGTAMVDDVIDATKAVQKMGVAKDGAVCIFGGSYGAFSALSAAVREPELYQCAVGNAGVYDLEMLYQDDRESNYWRRDGIFREALGDDLEAMKNMSPVNHASSINAKVLLIHGKRDQRTPIEQAEDMKEALEKAGQKPEWLKFRDSGHGVRGDDERREFHKTLIEFLKKNI